MHARRLVDEKGNPLNKSNPMQIESVGKIETKYESKPVAVPSTSLQVELKYFASYPRPTSIGADGNVYGTLGGAKTNTIFRSTDSFATIEEGAIFTETVIFVIKLKTKYVVVTQNKANLTGSIWTSDVFASGFTKQVSIVDAYPELLAITWNHGALHSVLLVGEYGQTGTQKKLHFTGNGGSTFSVIKQTTVIDPLVNSHFHNAIFDEYRGRIWASQGDGVNGKISFSDDLGATWIDLTVPTNTFGISIYQPTLMVATSDKLFMAPDTHAISPSVLSLKMDTTFVKLNTETFNLGWEHSVWDKEFCYNQYGQAPFVKDKSEIYILFPNFNNKKKHFIVASGDGGNTWHTVLSLINCTFTAGLVGTDKNGFMYGYYVDSVSNPYVLKTPKIEWIRK